MAGMGREHRYVPLGYTPQRNHNNTFSFLPCYSKVSIKSEEMKKYKGSCWITNSCEEGETFLHAPPSVLFLSLLPLWGSANIPLSFSHVMHSD